MKKLLLGLGTIATIAAPVSAVVACGASNGGEIGGAKATPEQAAINNMLAGSIGSYEAWPLSSEDVEIAIENTRENGIIKNLDFSTNPEATIKSGITPIYTKKFTKADVIAAEKKEGSSEFVTIANEIVGKTDKTKMYIGSVRTVKADSVPANDGSYELNIYEKPSNLPLVQTAVDAFEDTSKFGFNEEFIKKVHGTYIYGADHSFQIGGSRDIFGTNVSIKSWFGGPFKDRISEDNLMAWTMFGPQKANVSTTKASFIDGDKKISLAHAFYLKDKKTRKLNLVLKIVEKDNGKVIDTQTLYIENDLLTSWSKTPFDDDGFKKLMVDHFSFTPVYNFFGKLKSSASMLSGGMGPLKELIISVSSKINLLAKSYKFANTTKFLSEFIDYLKVEKVDLNNMYQGAKDFEEMVKHNTGMMDYGGHAWNAINWADEILDRLSLFISQEVTAKHQTLFDIKDAASLETLIKNEANKAQRVKDATAFLAGHNPAILIKAGSTDDDILKLAEDTKTIDYKAAVAALSSTVTQFKTKLDAAEDVQKGTSVRQQWSEKSQLLGKFIDDNAMAIFGTAYSFPGTAGTGSNMPSKRSFAGASSDGLLGHDLNNRNHGQDFTIKGFINDVVKKILTKEQSDKLQATVLTPLGL